MRTSIDEIDGVFTYLVATADQLGMAKDAMAAKPMVLYESDDLSRWLRKKSPFEPFFPVKLTPGILMMRRSGYGRRKRRPLTWG